MSIWKVVFISLLMVVVFIIGFNVGGDRELKSQTDEKQSKLFIDVAAAEEHLKSGEFEEASLATMGVIVLAPEIHTGYLLYGDTLARQGCKETALWAYQKSLAKLEAESSALTFEMDNKNKTYERNLILTKIAELKGACASTNRQVRTNGFGTISVDGCGSAVGSR